TSILPNFTQVAIYQIQTKAEASFEVLSPKGINESTNMLKEPNHQSLCIVPARNVDFKTTVSPELLERCQATDFRAKATLEHDNVKTTLSPLRWRPRPLPHHLKSRPPRRISQNYGYDNS
ncbi:hypothetical protein MLD52_22955, partial [Puniceicoccaceae bacterium K14]|nr:hypothetical protein [Puniceicoccaceae bacterium K14]